MARAQGHVGGSVTEEVILVGKPKHSKQATKERTFQAQSTEKQVAWL